MNKRNLFEAFDSRGKLLFSTQSCVLDDGEQWSQKQVLGRGGFGLVHLGIVDKIESANDRSVMPIALKSAPLEEAGSLLNEFLTLSHIGVSQHIIRCYGSAITNSTDDSFRYNLTLEYASCGTLGEAIETSSPKGLPPHVVRRYAKDVLEGLHHIHSIGFMHADLKAHNILLFPSARGINMAKISDFGFCKRDVAPLVGGTDRYSAPECFKIRQKHPPADIWAFGCVLLEMLTGQTVYADINEDLKEHISAGNLPSFRSDLPGHAIDMLMNCFMIDTTKRWTAKALMGHPFLEFVDDVKSPPNKNCRNDEELSSLCSIVDDEDIISIETIDK